jgi:hypothetical protein
MASSTKVERLEERGYYFRSADDIMQVAETEK